MEKNMNLSKITRWIGPVAIGYGLFLVISDMSGMPLPLLDPGIDPRGSSVMGSGLILWAMVMLLVGMISLYARLLGAEGESVRRERAAEREARYLQWELDEEELFEEVVEWGVPEGQEAEELLATHATSR
jgi:formate-dependent nitrite reductase membrane component NrfD